MTFYLFNTCLEKKCMNKLQVYIYFINIYKVYLLLILLMIYYIYFMILILGRVLLSNNHSAELQSSQFARLSLIVVLYDSHNSRSGTSYNTLIHWGFKGHLKTLDVFWQASTVIHISNHILGQDWEERHDCVSLHACCAINERYQTRGGGGITCFELGNIHLKSRNKGEDMLYCECYSQL